MEELLKELEEAKAKIAEIEKKIEEKQEKEKSRRWQPEYGGRYWLLQTDGPIVRDRWDDHNADYFRYSIGNCFKTEEDVKFIAEKLKVITKLKEFAEPKDVVWGGSKAHYYIVWNCIRCEINICSTCIIKQNEIYFASKDDAIKAVGTVGKDRIRKYYLGM